MKRQAPPAVLFYQLKRFDRKKSMCLCVRHLENRLLLGWRRLAARKSLSPRPDCEDCGKSQEETPMGQAIVKQARIDAEELARLSPRPTRVLPGQKKLPGI